MFSVVVKETSVTSNCQFFLGGLAAGLLCSTRTMTSAGCLNRDVAIVDIAGDISLEFSFSLGFFP